MGNQPSTTVFQVGYLGVEPRPFCSQSRRATICTCTRFVLFLLQSERLNSNRRSSGRRPGAIARLRQVLFRFCPSSPCGSRTQPTRLEKPMTSPEVERATLCALFERKVGREVLEPSSAVLQTAAIPSQLPAHVVVRARKNPVSIALVTPGSN